MKHVEHLNQRTLEEAFAYDPLTGVLTWKERPEGQFKDASYARRVNRRFAGKPAGRTHESGEGRCYKRVYFDGRFLYIHRVIWVMHYGEIPAGQIIDHINGDGTDNRLENLRLVTPGGNNQNMRLRTDNTSGHVGVWFNSPTQKWAARGALKGRSYSLGHYKSKDEAIAARRRWELNNEFHPNHGSAR